MILEKSLYLGTSDQAGDQRVISSLGITHVLSTSRVRTEKFRGLVYILVNKSSFSHSTLKLTTNFILDAITSGGSVLVHGCDGLDQSAAVVLAALMRHHSATIEDCLWFLTAFAASKWRAWAACPEPKLFVWGAGDVYAALPPALGRLEPAPR